MKRKFLALLLAFVMVVGMLPMAAMAEAAGTPPSVVKAPLGDTKNVYSPELLNIDGYAVEAVADAESTADNVTAVYNVTVTHPALLKHFNAANPAAEGLWVGIGVPINTKGTGDNPGQNGTGSSYFAFLTDKKDFSEIVTMFKEKDWAGNGQPGYSEYGWRSNDGTHLFQWYNVAGDNYQSSSGYTPYLVERNPDSSGDTTTYTYNVYRIKFDVTEGHLVTITEPENGTLAVMDDGESVKSSNPVAVGTELTITATPAEHYQISAVKVDGTAIDEQSGAYTYTIPATGGKDVTISAEFTEVKHTVTFNANGGQFDGESETTKTVEVVEGQKVASGNIPTPTYTDKVFVGWGTAANATETVDVANQAVTADVTYYAVWKDKVTEGISAGFSWKAADANKARKDAVAAAGKEALDVTDSLDQTVWFMINGDVKGNHYWFEITDGTTAIWDGAMDYEAEATARGMIAASFLHNGQNEADKTVPATLVVNVWKTDGAVTEKPGGDPTATQTITTGTNPLKLDSVTPNVAEKKVTAKFNQDLLGRYVIELKKGDDVVKTATTECVAPTPAVAQATGYTFEDVTFTAGTYTVNVYQASANAETVKVGSAIDSKSFILSDAISSVKVMETVTNEDETTTEVESTVLTAEVNAADHKITISGKIANPETKTVKLVALGTDGATVGTVDTLTLTYNDGEFSISEGTKLTTILGTEYSVVLGEITAIETPVVPPATTVNADDAKLPSGTTPEEKENLVTAASSVTPDAAATTTLTNLATDAALAVDVSKENPNETHYNEEAAKRALDNESITTDQQTVTVVVQPYLDVQLKEYTVDETTSTKKLELDISAQYRVIATTADLDNSDEIKVAGEVGEGDTANAVDITQPGENTKLTVTESITLTITLPEGFLDADRTVYVLHNGAHYHGGTYTDSNRQLSFTSDDGLSPFVIDTGAQMVAKIGETFYATLQKAVDVVVQDGTITLLTDAAVNSATVNKAIIFTVAPNGHTLDENAISAGSGYSLTKTTEGGNTKYTVTKTSTPVDPVEPTTPVESVTLDKSTLSLKVGDTGTLTATVVPDDATDKSVVWASSDASVATVDQNGKVTAVSEGTATITATAGGKSASCTVTVTKESGGGDNPGGSGGSGGGGGGSSSVSSGYAVSVPASVSNGKVSVSPKSAAEGKTVTITATPDDGYEVGAVTVTDKDGNQIEVTDAGGGKYTFTMPKSKVDVMVEFVEKQGQTDPVTVRFVDVDSSAWYADAVNWAVSEGITAGTSATTFSPDAPCTRAQVVTFLWRAAGSPKATGSNPFTDVSEGDYYYDAVLWAVEKGVTMGTSAATFSPDTVCTRAQIVTFLWRYEESPTAAGSSSFTDVAQSDWFYSAVNWAVSEGITAGTGAGKFSPNADCTRAQTVTFLYRDMA